MMRIEARGLRKVFNRRVIFRDVSFSLGEGEVLLVTGRNGSGKSTLVKIISHVLSPSAGTVEFALDGAPVRGMVVRHLGLVSPYLQLYDEFTAAEHLRFAMTIRGLRPDPAGADDVLRRVGLHHRKEDAVRTYSSGMKQRLKYAFALLHRPPVLLLDEPMSNLDAEGVAMVRGLMEEQRGKGVLVVATNDLTDLERYDARVDLNGRER
jgi:heme exporter protein A